MRIFLVGMVIAPVGFYISPIGMCISLVGAVIPPIGFYICLVSWVKGKAIYDDFGKKARIIW